MLCLAMFFLPISSKCSKIPKRFRCYNRHGFVVVHHKTIQGMIWCPLEQQVLPDGGQLLRPPPGMGPMNIYTVDGFRNLAQKTPGMLIKLVKKGSSWWLNPPIWKICSSNSIISTGRGENKKYLKPPTRGNKLPSSTGWIEFLNNQQTSLRLGFIPRSYRIFLDHQQNHNL